MSEAPAAAYVRADEHGVLRVGRSRVTLDSVVAAFEAGHSPETIREQYPALSLEEVYGALTYYLAHAPEVEAYLRRQDAVWVSGRARLDREPGAAVGRLPDAARIRTRPGMGAVLAAGLVAHDRAHRRVVQQEQPQRGAGE
jgi:uncharacterized protein (DUF433 family)